MPKTDAETPVHEDDLDAVRAWFRSLETRVNALDFAGGHELVVDHFIAFGTFSTFMEGREQAEEVQWRRVWPTISDFHFRLDEVRALASPDRLMAVGLAVFDSTGTAEDGSTFPRPGRATASFIRAAVGDPWRCNHSHMSLVRGTPQVSFGKRTA